MLRTTGLLLALLCAHGPALALSPAEVPAPRFLAVPAAGGPLSVTPDRADWTYPLTPGANASVRIRVDLKPYPAAGVPIRYRLGPDMLEGEERSALVPPAGLVLPVATPAKPGFVRAIVSATIDGKELRRAATLGFAPELIAPVQTSPADFDAFWSAQKAALAKVPADYQLTPAPALSNDQIEVSYLSYDNVGHRGGVSRFYGVLAVPRKGGPFPLVLSVPGAGVRGYSGNRAMAEQGAITLQLGIHGIPVNLAPELYEQLGKGALSEYNRFNLDNRDSYYYRRVYLGVLRGADYLASHPKWNGKQFIVMGGSQGGQLAIMASALEPRVTAVAANYPAYSDVTGYLHGRAGGWPGLFRPDPSGQPGDAPVEPKLATTRYYDTVNFARRLKIPGHYSFGYNDMVTPPTSTYAVYNSIVAPKQLLLAPDQAHTTSAEQSAVVQAWVLQQAGLGK